MGSLSRPAEALVPIVAAACGMVVPAGIYLVINLAAPDGHPRGWAIPMATDIAFALAILAVVAPSLPGSLRAFLLTLAIVDDLGAILVIAVVFTAQIELSGWPVRWLRGGLVAAPAPTRPRLVPLRAAGRHLLGLRLAERRPSDPGRGAARTADPLLRHRSDRPGRCLGARLATDLGRDSRADLRPVGGRSRGFAQPTLARLFVEPVGLGVILGLVVGKAVGVFGGAYLTARFTRAALAPDLRWSEVFAVAVLGGVGFTVALLISDLAFEGRPELQDQGKAAVLVASLLAAALGGGVHFDGRARAR